MIDLELDERLFQSYTMKFSIKADDPKWVDLKEDAMLEYGGERWFITKVERKRDSKKALHTITAEVAWMRLADVKRVGSFTMVDHTPRQGLAAILNDTGWNAVETTPVVGAYSLEETDASVLDLVWKWAKICGLEPAMASLDHGIGLVAQVGSNTGLSFRYARNLQEITRTAEPPKVTRLFPFGRNGLDITALNSGKTYLEDYSYYTGSGITLEEAQANYRKDDIFSDDTFIDDQSLYDAGVARLAVLAQPAVMYAASVVDLTSLMQIPENEFRSGDVVYVYDDVLSIQGDARVTRRQHFPLSPKDDKIELSFSDVLLPDVDSNSARTNTTQSWELFESRNWETERRVRDGSTILHRLVLTTIEGAEWVVGFALKGTAVGNSTVSISCVDDNTGLTVWPSYSKAVTNGQEILFNFTFGQKEIPAGEYVIVVRAQSNTAAAGFNIVELDTALWVLARGTTRSSITLPNTIRFDYTGTIQNWTVPDDVTEITVQAFGGRGGSAVSTPPSDRTGGNGGGVTAKFPVTGGDMYDVFVGQFVNVSVGAGWPDAGAGDPQSIGGGGGGGGSTSLRPHDGAKSTTLILASGGGGAGRDSIGGPLAQSGGDGGFYAGNNGQDGSGGVIGQGGRGATQDAGGAGGSGSSGLGAAGTAISGGAAGDTTNNFAFAGGGGGGGWYGGGGASSVGVAGQYAGGGGGGSGWVGPTGYDLEVTDGANDAAGYLIISWETPDET